MESHPNLRRFQVSSEDSSFQAFQFFLNCQALPERSSLIPKPWLRCLQWWTILQKLPRCSQLTSVLLLSLVRVWRACDLGIKHWLLSYVRRTSSSTCQGCPWAATMGLLVLRSCWYSRVSSAKTLDMRSLASSLWWLRGERWISSILRISSVFRVSS